MHHSFIHSWKGPFTQNMLFEQWNFFLIVTYFNLILTTFNLIGAFSEAAEDVRREQATASYVCLVHVYLL